MKRQKGKAGFTLVEIMVSMAFFSLVIIGVAQAIVTGQQHSRAVEENALILAKCEDLMRQMSEMSIPDVANENGTVFSIGGVEGSGAVSVTNPYLSSNDIANVVLSWNGHPVLKRAFGNATMAASGGGSGGGTPPAEPEWYDVAHVIISPNYPSNYPNNYDHTWTITEPGALKMKVHFSAFETYNSYDKVYIRNGSGVTQATYYGDKGAFTSVEVNGDTIQIRFYTSTMYTDPGWKIDKYQYYK